MYWISNESSTQLRLFKWQDADAFVLEFLRTVSATNFSNPDCRGGANNVDWIEGFTSWSSQGFRARTAIAGPNILTQWPSANDANHPNAYVRAAMFQEPGLVFQTEPDIWNSSGCFSFPALGTNERFGHYGLAIAFGGKNGGGGPAVQAYVGIDDDFTPGLGAFPSVSLVASGTHNPTRYGDYLKVDAHRPCGYWWIASAFALDGGTAGSNVNARYVEFGRERDRRCYEGWRDETRVP
jgi:hypothetical protein